MKMAVLLITSYCEMCFSPLKHIHKTENTILKIVFSVILIIWKIYSQSCFQHNSLFTVMLYKINKWYSLLDVVLWGSWNNKKKNIELGIILEIILTKSFQPHRGTEPYRDCEACSGSLNWLMDRVKGFFCDHGTNS